jgi:hypothetical protein
LNRLRSCHILYGSTPEERRSRRKESSEAIDIAYSLLLCDSEFPQTEKLIFDL